MLVRAIAAVLKSHYKAVCQRVLRALEFAAFVTAVHPRKASINATSVRPEGASMLVKTTCPSRSSRFGHFGSSKRCTYSARC